MSTSESGLVFRGVRPLLRLGSLSRKLTIGDLLPIGPAVPATLRAVPPDAWPGDAARGRDMIGGAFRFAGLTIAREGLSWEPAGATPEWLAALHGFEWLRDLRSAGGERARRMAREMVALWIDQYPKPGEGPAWRTEAVGARLTAWISFHELFCASADEGFRHAYFTSLSRQARHLEKALPGELIGLPLMKALRGLAYAGLALEDGDARLEQAFSLILEQIEEQILPDGTHVSRSPRQTFEFLQCLVDLRTALIAAKMELPEEIQHGIDRLAPTVKMLRHADGGLAQFNGGQEGNAHLVEVTLMHSGARGKAMKSLPQGGYERLTLGRASLLMDTGATLSSAYGDRAHAGLLAFEYTYGRDRLFVNCGTSEAEGGKWRRVLRSTLAHTTLAVDNRNACAFPGEGRISTRPAVRARRPSDDSLEAAHDGYMARYGVAYTRRLYLNDQGETLRGEEELSGRTRTPFAARFHLHPGIQAWQEDGVIYLRAKSGLSWRFTAGAASVHLEESVYVSEDENPQPCMQIVLTGETDTSPTMVGWELRKI